ncbi:hypothetical protein [Dehalobacter sp. TBBPA1]|uniref:hypothetical protein n=1 Tax=Dehalobacter sp. TBBPA1 TaxID=3235037 RepID=UPI0034A473C7
MKCKAGKNWGKNTYKCCRCGTIVILNTNDEILQCCSCGNDEFDAPIKFERSQMGFKEKLDEIVRILEVNIFLCEGLKIEAFYNVIAVQLRILLCDINPVISSVIQNPMFHPHTGKVFEGTDDFKSILSENLFDKSKETIPLDDWLTQEIVWSRQWDSMNVKEVINAWANKNGGAHVDPVIPEKAMFAIAVSGKDYLLAIGRYVIELLGYDLNNDLVEIVFKPYGKMLNS